MDHGLYSRSTTASAADGQVLFDEGLRQHMLRVFNYMVLGLVITGLTAGAVASSPALMATIFGSPLKIVVMLAPLAFVLVLSFGINKLSAAQAQMVFWGYCFAMGISLSTIFMVFSGGSIARVFFISAAMFASASLYGYTTKKDLTSMGGFLMMALFGIIIASLVNMFIGSSAVQFAVSVIGVLVFTGLTAYDTQEIKEMYAENLGTEAAGKTAVLGALSLYLNFINLFMHLLNLLGSRE